MHTKKKYLTCYNRFMKKIYFTVAAVVVLAGAVVLLRPWQKSDGDDTVRYRKLLEACQTQYNADKAAGKQFFANPCSEDQLRTQFRQKYGHSYQGKE